MTTHWNDLTVLNNINSQFEYSNIKEEYVIERKKNSS